MNTTNTIFCPACKNDKHWSHFEEDSRRRRMCRTCNACRTQAQNEREYAARCGTTRKQMMDLAREDEDAIKELEENVAAYASVNGKKSASALLNIILDRLNDSE